MTEPQQHSTMPVIEPFTLQRIGGHIEISPCPDGEGYWHYRFVPTNPRPQKVPMGYYELTAEGPKEVTEERVVEPPTQHNTTEAILTAFSPEDARLFMGWLSHVCEHSHAHIGACIDALKLAYDEHRFTGMQTIVEEVYAAVNAQELAIAAGKQALDLT